MADVTLKPCPFCGGEARVYEDDDGDWRVCCRDGLTYGCLGYWTIDRFYPIKAEAIAAWNSRAERTCRMEYQTEGMQRGWWKCSECGEAMDTIEACAGRKPPKWCGNCGARVEVGE